MADSRFDASEVEKRIAAFREENGAVLFGERLKSQTDPTLALPDNLGANVPEVPPPSASA